MLSISHIKLNKKDRNKKGLTHTIYEGKKIEFSQFKMLHIFSKFRCKCRPKISNYIIYKTSTLG